jgi:transposase
LKMPPTKDVKRAAVELWKASVPLKQIRAQLKIPERSLRRILDHAKKNSDAPIAERKPGSGRPSVISRELKIKIKELLRKKPDLNPIENVWSWMKRQLKEAPCTNLEELKREILKLWCQKMEDCEYLRHLVESMPRRLEEVIQREGAMTKY